VGPLPEKRISPKRYFRFHTPPCFLLLLRFSFVVCDSLFIQLQGLFLLRIEFFFFLKFDNSHPSPAFVGVRMREPLINSFLPLMTAADFLKIFLPDLPSPTVSLFLAVYPFHLRKTFFFGLPCGRCPLCRPVPTPSYKSRLRGHLLASRSFFRKASWSSVFFSKGFFFLPLGKALPSHPCLPWPPFYPNRGRWSLFLSPVVSSPPPPSPRTASLSLNPRLSFELPPTKTTLPPGSLVPPFQIERNLPEPPLFFFLVLTDDDVPALGGFPCLVQPIIWGHLTFFDTG